MPSTFADRVIAFNRNLQFTGNLPEGTRIMNPFQENPLVLDISSAFYKKYYDDNRKRRLILGINPGRHGAGATGVPFTDGKRLRDRCGLKIEGVRTHEPSSVFVYELIDAYGGMEAFYNNFYIASICPLGFVRVKENGREVNYNYYDSKALTEAVRPFIKQSLRAHLDFGVYTDVCFILGTGKNIKYMKQFNAEWQLFDKLVALEHPRYVMQYKFKQKEAYIERFLEYLAI